MVNNSTNINKTNNYITTLIIVHKKKMTYWVGNQSHGLGQAQQCGRLNRLMGSKPSSFDNWISSDISDINKQYSLPLKKTTHTKKSI